MEVLRWKPWSGVRAYDLSDTFAPIDVQASLASAAFGSFYDSYRRQIRLQVRIDR